MTLAAILFCTTLITAVPHGSVVEKNCRFVEPPFTLKRTFAEAKETETVVDESDSVSSTPVVPPIAKPASKTTKLYKVRTRKVYARRKAHRRHDQVLVMPVASDITEKKTSLSLWEKLKRFELFN